jgi:hypothetical protein
MCIQTIAQTSKQQLKAQSEIKKRDAYYKKWMLIVKDNCY